MSSREMPFPLLRAGVISLAVGAMMAAGQGVASADRGNATERDGKAASNAEQTAGEAQSAASSPRASRSAGSSVRTRTALPAASDPDSTPGVELDGEALDPVEDEFTPPADTTDSEPVDSEPVDSEPVDLAPLEATRNSGPGVSDPRDSSAAVPPAPAAAEPLSVGAPVSVEAPVPVEVIGSAAGELPEAVLATVGTGPVATGKASRAVAEPFKLFGDGTAESPNAGLLWGNGFSYDASTCAAGEVCNGGNAGMLFGDGGNGWNGGNGGDAGILGRNFTPTLFFIPIPALYSSAGNGGDASADCVALKITCNGGNGGNGARFSLFSQGGYGGDGNTEAGGIGGKGGTGGLLGIAGNPGRPQPELSGASAKATAGGAFKLFGNGTAESPDAGLLWGDGFSYDAWTCPDDKPCDGGKAGLFFGDGGNGWNGGKGGDSGFLGTHAVTIGLLPIPLGFYSIAGNGGDASTDCEALKITCNGGDGGNGARFSLFSKGGDGGNGNAAAGGVGGKGGSGGLILDGSGRDGEPQPNG